MNQPPLDRAAFLRTLRRCHTEEQLFSRLTFACLAQYDEAQRPELLDDVRGAAYSLRLPAVEYKTDQWLHRCQDAIDTDRDAFLAAANAEARRENDKMRAEQTPVGPGVLADVPLQNVDWLVPDLLPLKAIAAARQCAVLLVMHSNKKQGVSDRKRLADSSDIWDMARSVLMMGRSNSDGKIYLSHEKSSYSRPQQTVLLHIEDVELDGVRTAQAVFDGYTDKKDADFIKEPRVRQAQTKEDTRDAILNVLAESRLGSMASPQLKSEVMREIGCSERTYKSAYAELVKAGDIGKRPIRQRDGTNKWYSFLYQGETGCTLPK